MKKHNAAEKGVIYPSKSTNTETAFALVGSAPHFYTLKPKAVFYLFLCTKTLSYRVTGLGLQNNSL
jgi:hypothetical protein